MRQDPFWIPAIRGLREDQHACGMAMALTAAIQRDLAAKVKTGRLLSDDTSRRLQACFSSLVSCCCCCCCFSPASMCTAVSACTSLASLTHELEHE